MYDLSDLGSWSSCCPLHTGAESTLISEMLPLTPALFLARFTPLDSTGPVTEARPFESTVEVFLDAEG